MKQKPPLDKDDPPQRRGRADSVAPDISRLAMAAFARAGFSDPTLVLRWAEIVDPDVARLTRPFRFSEGSEGGVLTLKTEPGAAIFLGHEARAICERINAYLGRPAVAKLKFLQGALQPRSARPASRQRLKPLPVTDPAINYKGPERLAHALLNLARSRNG